jgi:hypothetical protein
MPLYRWTELGTDQRAAPDISAQSCDPKNRGPAISRLLFVADAAVADVDELPPPARAAIEAAAEVYVLTPTLPGRLAWLADDVDGFRHIADDRLDIVLGHLDSIGVHATGAGLRGSILTVIADAVADFKPDHILLALRSSEHANWQEHKLIEQVEKGFGLPLTTYAIDPSGHVSNASRPTKALAECRSC